MKCLALLLLALVSSAQAADKKAVQPAGAGKPLGPYSPGIATGNYLYVSGQIARKPDGSLAQGIDAQIAQALENVRGVVESAGLKMANVVYADVYLADVNNYEALNRVWGKYFSSAPPARSVIGVRAMPASTPVEISAVAIRNLALRKPVRTPTPRAGAPIASGVMVDNRFFLGGLVGRDFATQRVPEDAREQVDLAIERASMVLRTAGLELRHLASATIYIDAQVPMDKLAKILADVLPSETAVTVVRAESLPFGAHFEITGVASRLARREGHCTSVAETLYCSARAGGIDTALKYVQQDLQAAKSSPSMVVSSKLFLDSIDNYNAVNSAYAKVFPSDPPARVTLQPSNTAPELTLAPGTDRGKPEGGPQVQLSVIA
ncbi:MAG TPA: Rid family hydrolase, partial [Bryobacteraceae bacterium]|nr:Rid family hydrolase [Bryobacteraceae bacterium]